MPPAVAGVGALSVSFSSPPRFFLVSPANYYHAFPVPGVAKSFETRIAYTVDATPALGSSPVCLLSVGLSCQLSAVTVSRSELNSDDRRFRYYPTLSVSHPAAAAAANENSEHRRARGTRVAFLFLLPAVGLGCFALLLFFEPGQARLNACRTSERASGRSGSASLRSRSGPRSPRIVCSGSLAQIPHRLPAAIWLADSCIAVAAAATSVRKTEYLLRENPAAAEATVAAAAAAAAATSSSSRGRTRDRRTDAINGKPPWPISQRKSLGRRLAALPRPTGYWAPLAREIPDPRIPEPSQCGALPCLALLALGCPVGGGCGVDLDVDAAVGCPGPEPEPEPHP